jgi:hypothetical protein
MIWSVPEYVPAVAVARSAARIVTIRLALSWDGLQRREFALLPNPENATPGCSIVPEVALTESAHCTS